MAFIVYDCLAENKKGTRRLMGLMVLMYKH